MCKWLEVKESKPKCNVDVLVTNGKVVTVMYLNEYGNFYSLHSFCLLSSDEVTHWMSLPKPPKVL